VIFGSWQKPEIPQWHGPVHAMGRLHDEATLALLYNAADVFVAPSVQDNFPNTVLEALACGTPCVAFNSSGPAELSEHQRQGYLAEPFDPHDLARGIEWVLQDEERRRRLAQQARERAVQEYSLEEIAGRYLALYRETRERYRLSRSSSPPVAS
jgi:glycosyltransferase involved in cell wall biosynthesis